MKNNNFWKVDVANKRYSVMLAFSYIVLCILSITFLFLIMFSWFNKYLQKEIYDMSIVQLNNTSGIVNNQFDYYRTVLQNMFQEPSIKTSLYSEKYDPLNEWNISRYLNYALNNDGCIDYSAIYQNGKLKQIVGSVHPSDEEQQELVDYLLQSHNDKDIFYIKNDRDSHNRLFLFRMESDVFGKAPQRGILFAINQEKLSNNILSKTDEKHGYYVFDKQGNQIIHQGNFQDDLLQKIWGNVKNEGDNVFVDEIKADDGTYFAVATYNPAYDLRFVQLINISETNTTLQETLTLALISLVVIILLCSLLAIVMTYFVYKPLKLFFSKLTSYTDVLEESKEYSNQLTQITSEKIISQVSNITRHFHTDKVLSYLDDEPSHSTPPSILRISERKENMVLVYAKSKIGVISQEQYSTLFTKFKEALIDISSIEMFPEEKGNYCVYLLIDKNKKDSILCRRNELLSKLRKHLQTLKETVVSKVL